MADERTLREAWRAIDDLKAERGQYVLKDVYLAEQRADRANIERLQDDDTSKATGTRAWLLNLAGIIVGVVVSGIVTVLIARGGH